MLTRRGLVLGTVLLIVAGCSAASMESKPMVDVTGDWNGSWRPASAGGGGGGMARASLKQDGALVSGTVSATGAQIPRSGLVSGRVVGDTITVNTPDGVKGDLKVKGDEISGTMQGVEPFVVVLRRQR